MQIKILFFATLRDLAGQRELQISMTEQSPTVANVRTHLIEQYPDLAAHLKAALVAINEEYAFGTESVADGDTIAFFPPVSGGNDHPEYFALAQEPIDHDAIVAMITTPSTGAVCLFSGMVRGNTTREGHLPATEYLEYEAYEPMAIAKMKQVAQEIRAQYPLVQGIAIIQRIGKLSVGQNTILIACSSGHRDEGCFEASRYGIDRLKEIVPVWKKEVSSDRQTWIEGNYRPTPDDQQV